MTQDQYVNDVIQRHKLPEKMDTFTEKNIVIPLKQVISNWAGSCLCEIKLSGSRAKGTAIDISTDLDLFISLSSTTNISLEEIYDSLYERMVEEGFKARKQNVSIGITYLGRKIDLVPARRQSQYGNDHSLYKRKDNSWTKTNIDTHICHVRKSGRIREIVALKIWRENHGLSFPSIYMETYAIESLRGRSMNAPADNFIYLLKDIHDNLNVRQIVDPANSNNILSDELSLTEKKVLQKKAGESIQEQYWSNIIW